jgi:ubiquinone/menaquinone biosynthesis C-methylase UbiE
VSSPTSLDFYDAELRAHHEHLRAAYGIGPGDEVVDIGCGTGLTTREAGRAAAPGRVVGVDVSERMLERARQSDGRRTPGVERLLEGAARLAADSDWL